MKILTITVMTLMLFGCTRNAEMSVVGDITVKEAIDFYKTLPTVTDWLKKINAVPQGTPDRHTWRIKLKDGALQYIEHEVSGVLYVDRLRCDPEDAHSLELLMTELKGGLLPQFVHQGLSESDQMILYSLDPENRTDNLEKRPLFQGYPILGEFQVVSADDRRIIAQTVEGSVSAWDGSYMMCFEPRHGIRITKGSQRFELLVCFECQHIYVYVGDQKDIRHSTGLTGSPSSLNRILRAAKILLPKQAGEH